jgi:hypothetical protein
MVALEAVYTLCPRLDDGVHCSPLSVTCSAILSYDKSLTSIHNNTWKNRLWGSYIAIHNYTFTVNNNAAYTCHAEHWSNAYIMPSENIDLQQSISPSTVKNYLYNDKKLIYKRKYTNPYLLSLFCNIYKFFAFSNFFNFWLAINISYLALIDPKCC